MNKSKTVRSQIKGSVLAVLLALVLAARGALSACNGSSTPIAFEDTEITMYVGDSETLKYTTADEDPDITWTSSNEKVVTVRRGTVKANAEGTATIAATVDGGQATCVVTVLNRTVTISQATATIDLDDANHSFTLTATSSDGGAITWQSSDTTIATVNGGVVTATGSDIGDVIITASRGAASATCVVSVIQSSRPEDYYKLTQQTNANCIADPGVWHYFADGSSGTNYTFAKEPVHQNNSVSVTLGNLDLANSRYFYFRYQPDLAAGTEYTLTFTVTMTNDGKIRMYNGSGSTVKVISVKAGEAQEVAYVGTVNESEPFSVRINECSALAAGTETALELSAIKVEEGNNAPVVSQDPKRSDKADLAEYDISLATNAEIVLDRGAWYYSADGEPNTDYAFAETPRYAAGAANLSFTHLKGQRSVYQLRYQPDYAVGTYYKLTATVTLTAAGSINYGTKVSDSEIYYTAYTFEQAGSYDIEFTGFVNGSFPFSVGLTPSDYESPIAMSVSNLVVAETDAPEPPVGESYNLELKTNSEVCAAPGVWAYTSSEGTFASAPSYKDGVVTLAMATMVNNGTYQLRYQPDLAEGTEYTATFTVILTGDAYFLYGNDYKSSKDLTANEDGSYSVTWTGTVSNAPFMVQIKSNDGYATPVTLVVKDFTISASGNTPADETYALLKKTNSEVCAAPGIWAYTAEQGCSFVSEPAYDNGTITFALATMPVNANGSYTYQLRYQPDLAEGTSYTVTFKVVLTSEDETAYFLYGNNYKNSKDLTANEDGSYNVSWTGTVSATAPFMIQIKSGSYDKPISLVVSNVIVTAA